MNKNIVQISSSFSFFIKTKNFLEGHTQWDTKGNIRKENPIRNESVWQALLSKT